MFAVELDRENLEYDVHSLVQAFYPGEQVRVLIPESSAEKRAQLQDKVRIRVRMDRSGAKVTIDGREYAWEGPDWSEGKGETGEVSSGEQKAPDASKKFKDGFKSFLYRTLCQVTGRELPWGSLTGIRPTKIAYQLLEEGKSEEEADRILRDTYFVSESRRKLCLPCAKAGLEAKRELQKNEISLYVGIPFCPTRCAYCSFVSNSVEKSFHLVEPYLQALLAEADSAAAMVKDLGLKVRSFYMGGGTPTTLTAEQMDRLLGRLREGFDLADAVELTVEAGRPDTITAEKLAVLRKNDVDRISVNPQSMDDRVLAAIGRRHSGDGIRAAMELVSAAGFPHVNMDLIAGLPEDTRSSFRRTLDEVISFGTDNITIHTLSLKKGSRITLEGTRIPTVEEVAAMLDYAASALGAAGFSPYYLYRQKYMSGSFENVGWCRPGGTGWYNIYIMEELHTILSLGAGGSTKMVDPYRGRIERVFNAKYPQEYIQRPEKLSANRVAFRAFYTRMNQE